MCHAEETDGKEHAHHHEQEHEHAHGHEPELSQDVDPSERQKARLAYFYEHSCSHMSELEKLLDWFSEAGNDETAQRIREAMELYGEANERLAKALEALKEE